jgi:hypothetical protein
VQDEVRAMEGVVPRSADNLLEAAAPHRKQAVEKATEAQTAAIARAAELLAAVDAALDEAQTATSERFWLGRLDGRRRSIEPFRPGVGGDPSLSQLRATLSSAFAAWQEQHDRRQAEFDQRRAIEAEEEAARLRHEEQARREAAAQRIVTEGGTIIERGGRAVRQTGFGFQPVEEEDA